MVELEVEARRLVSMLLEQVEEEAEAQSVLLWLVVVEGVLDDLQVRESWEH